MNIWTGKTLRLSIFGESHGNAVGAVLDGLPCGIALDMERIAGALEKRKPRSSRFATKRNETDEYEILSGVTNGVTNGNPLCVIFRNADANSAEYNANVPRPGHADFAARIKLGEYCDIRGGGHFSARLTAPIVFMGAICEQLLLEHQIHVAVTISAIGKAKAKGFYDVKPTRELLHSLDTVFPIIDKNDMPMLEMELDAAKAEGDSVGGTVDCCIIGVPIGLGEPFFCSIESSMAQLCFSIPAVKGIEFGRGFELAQMRGSVANDEYNADAIKDFFNGLNNTAEIAYTNNAGGINGGLSNSMPILFRTAFKPIPSVARELRSVDMQSLEPVIVRTEGRHDVCAALRGAFVVRAFACICVLDFLLGGAQG